jgi:transglutaminase-like putative cysteine protease
LKIHHVALASAALVVSTQASSVVLKEVQYGPAPAWVRPSPAAVADTKDSDAVFRVIYQDNQERVGRGTLESYTAYRVKILKPEALPLGNIRLAWSPSAGTATVHAVRIIRDGAVIDVLKQAKLKILERETGLEQSMLDGNLTATLQVPDLRVGDELEFAATIIRNEPAFGSHNAGVAQIRAGGIPGTFRYRLLWPVASAMTTRLSNDLPATAPTVENGFKVLDIELRDPSTIADIEGAPSRYNVHRTIEYSDYSGWPGLSKQMWPLFDTASRLEPNSPIRAEAAKIAAASNDPVTRAEAALRLVEDQVRYVYVGLNGGNYVPASADETWKRRFGDCKAKTVLLMALLRELGIKAEPVVVNSNGGDGTDEHLPNPELFDHVLVRASIAGKDYWLDGTRLGDRHLDMIPTPAFQWALPLTARGSDLVNVAPITTIYPQLVSVVDIDATAGFANDATWTIKQVIHGDEAFGISTSLATISPADAERAVKAYFRQSMSDVEPDEVAWRYDERHASVVLSMKGKAKVDWEGDESDGHKLTLIGAGFYAPDKLERPKDQDQGAAWSVTYPKFRCYATTVHLPAATKGFRWTYSSKPVNRQLAGVTYWRAAGLQDNVVRTVMSSQSFRREVPASEAVQINAQIPTFDNYMSSVEETSSMPEKAAALPFTEEPDWIANPAVCSPPAR